MTAKLKILMLVDSLAIGGTETHVLTVATALQKLGHQIIIGTSGGPLTQHFQRAGLHVVNMSFQDDNPIHTNYTELLAQTRQIVQEYDIDLIHAHLIAGLKIAVQISQELLVPVVFTAHGMFYPFRQLQSLIHGCAHVIAVSPPVANWLSNRIAYPKTQTSIIPNPIDTAHFSPSQETSTFRQELGITDEEKLITVCSRIAWGKTRVIETAINAIESLSAEHNVRLAIVGSGPDSPFIHALASMVNKRSERDLIILTGAMLDPLEAYRASDLVIGTARVALEALSCGTPVLAAGNSGYFGLVTPESFTKGWKVYFGDHDFVRPLSVTQMRSDIATTLSAYPDKATKEKLRRLVKKDFAIEKVIRQLLQVYYDVIGIDAETNKTSQPSVLDEPDGPPAVSVPEPDEVSTSPEVEPMPEEATTLKNTPPVERFPNSPVVSVAIPTYNRADYLDECLAGLFAQTYRPLEIIVVDDCSTDNTGQIVQKWITQAENDESISVTYFKLPRNLGFAYAQSIGYFLSSGEFIANHDSDDISHPERIQKQVHFLQLNEDYSLVGTNYGAFTDDITKLKRSYLVRYDNNIIKCYREGNHCVCFGSLLFRRNVLEKIGGLTTFMRGAEDYEFIARAIVQGFNVQNLREILYYYRTHEQQRSREFYSLRNTLTKHAENQGEH